MSCLYMCTTYRSAIQNAFQMVQQLKTLNAQLVAKMSDALR